MTTSGQVIVIPCVQILNDVAACIRRHSTKKRGTWRKLPPSSTPSSTRISAFGAASGGKKELGHDVISGADSKAEAKPQGSLQVIMPTFFWRGHEGRLELGKANHRVAVIEAEDDSL
jgi:hypothetical protein